MPLPPGPAAPAALQPFERIARTTALRRRAQARYGEPFTIRTLWADGPMVLVSDPEEVRRGFTAPPHGLRGGGGLGLLRPGAAARSRASSSRSRGRARSCCSTATSTCASGG